MTGDGRKLEPKFGLDMDFGEALARFAQTKPKEVGESIERSKAKQPPQDGDVDARSKIKRPPPGTKPGGGG